MSRIFISYRREDAPGHAGRLYDRLTAHFGADQVFIDIDTIEPGEDFVKAIEIAVGSVDTLIAVIGRSWLAVSDPSTGRRRLENANDYVRLEIKTALQRNVRVIPVLVQQASMPLETELPTDIAGLTRRNALELGDQHWRAGVERLLETVVKVLDERGVAQSERQSPVQSGGGTESLIGAKELSPPESKPVEHGKQESLRPRGADRAEPVIFHRREPREICGFVHDAPVERVGLSRDGRTLAAAGGEDTVVVWSPDTGKEVARLTHAGSIQAITFSPDGTLLATGADHSARLWETASGKEIARMSHRGMVTALTFSPDGHYLATASTDGTARVWDATSGGAVVLLKHNGPVSAVDFSPDSCRLATATSPAKISYVWEIPRGRELARVKHGFGAEGVKRVVFSPDGRKVISQHGWTVSVWEAATGRIAVKIKHEGFWPVLDGMAVSADGELLATFLSTDEDVHLWRIADAQEVARLPHALIRALSFDPLGRYLATAGCLEVQVWDLQGRPLASLPHEDFVSDLAVSADGTRLATASGKTARVWELG